MRALKEAIVSAATKCVMAERKSAGHCDVSICDSRATTASNGVATRLPECFCDITVCWMVFICWITTWQVCVLLGGSCGDEGDASADCGVWRPQIAPIKTANAKVPRATQPIFLRVMLYSPSAQADVVSIVVPTPRLKSGRRFYLDVGRFWGNSPCRRGSKRGVGVGVFRFYARRNCLDAPLS